MTASNERVAVHTRLSGRSLVGRIQLGEESNDVVVVVDSAIPREFAVEPCLVTFDLYHVRYWLLGEARRLGSSVVCVTVGQVTCAYGRDDERARAAKPASLIWHTGDDARSHQADVLDFDLRGVRLASAEFPPHGASVNLRVADDIANRVVTESRVLPQANGSAISEVLLRSAGADLSLVNMYLRSTFPALFDRRRLERQVVHTLFSDSGYLDLRAGTDPAPQWHALDADAVSRDVVYVASDERAIGHVSVTRAYPDTWLGHQLATLSGHPDVRKARRTLYLFFASLPELVDGQESMMLGYYDPTRRWHQTMFEDFVHELQDESAATIVRWDRFERRTPAPPQRPPRRAGVFVRPVQPTQTEAASQIVNAHLPRLAAQAMAIAPSTLRLHSVHPGYENTGLNRGRDVLGLWIDGTLRAVALCETGSPALSLFNVLNMAQLFVLPGAPPLLSQDLSELLWSVRSFYRAIGVNNPLVVAPPSSCDASREPGTFLAETMACIVWGGSSLRRYRHFLRLKFAETPRNSRPSPPVGSVHT